MDVARRAELNRALRRLADGDRTAFHPVFDLAWPVVRSFARSVLRGSDPSAAEDAAQQALLRVFERASWFDPDREALPWILGIAWNECRTLRGWRRRRREEPLEAARGTAVADHDAEERLLAEDLNRAVREALASLRPTDVETILASLEEGERPAISGVAFRKRLERARNRLRDAWRARHGLF